MTTRYTVRPTGTREECPLRKQYGEVVCRDGLLWALTYSEMGPPDQRQATGPCPYCMKDGDRE